jgi:DNA-binding response OmpR family regulator
MQGARPTRILIVEDNDDTAHVLRWGLEQLGYEVEIAHNGPLALALARSFSPDVALLDIGLPVMDGWVLAKRLRAQCAGLHVVAVTAYGAEADRLKSSEAGFSEHLVKPVDIDSIHGVVQRLIRSNSGSSSSSSNSSGSSGPDQHAG